MMVTVSVLVVISAGLIGAFLLLSRAMQNGVGVGKPLLFTTLIDWGQGSTNVRGLMTSLAAERIVQPQPA